MLLTAVPQILTVCTGHENKVKSNSISAPGNARQKSLMSTKIARCSQLTLHLRATGGTDF